MKLLLGDCIERMRELPANSVDTIIADGPYGIGFMGKEWDNFKPKELSTAVRRSSRKKETNNPESRHSGSPALEAGRYDRSLRGNIAFQNWFRAISIGMLRVAKPGGTLLCFGGTQTYHRLTCAVEEAGWILKDCIMWLYGSGFPKATDISKQLDKGCERKVTGKMKAPATPKKGTFKGTYVQNALKHGVAGLNIDGGRIPSGTEHMRGNVGAKVEETDWKNKTGFGKPFKATDSPLGRFPANIILDEEAAKLLDEQSGISKSSKVGFKGVGWKHSVLSSGKINDVYVYGMLSEEWIDNRRKVSNILKGMKIIEMGRHK